MPVIEDGNVRGSVSPTEQNLSWNRANVPTPISSLLIRATNADYAEYYINFENTDVKWITPYSGYLDISGGSTYLPLQLQNLNQLFGTNYRATVNITLTGPDGPNLLISSVINLSISGTAADAITTDKSNYNLIYNRVTNQLSGETIVNILNNSSDVELTLETIGSLLKEGSLTDEIILQEDAAYPFATNIELPEYGSVVVNCRIRREGVIISTFSVTIAVIGEKEVIVSPQNLSFTLREGFNETQNQVISIINPLNKAIVFTAPDWLNLNANSTNTTFDLSVTTDNSDSVNIGNYSGKILLTYGLEIIEIPVTLSVLQFLEFELKPQYFCKDNVKITLTKMIENARFVTVLAKMIFETSKGQETIDAEYAIPYFNDQAESDIGEKVQNFFPLFSDHLLDRTIGFDNVLVYKPAIISLTINEVDIDYKVLHSQVIDGINFFAGSRPKLFPLFTNYDIRRRYAGTSHIYSYWTGGLSPEDFAGKTIGSNPVTNNEVQAVNLSENDSSYLSIKEKMDLSYLTFPSTERKLLMQWLNGNLVPETFVFSGDYKITPEFEHTYDNFMIGGRKYESTELSKLTIFTGFMLKEEKQLLKEIINSVSIWINIEGEIYHGFSITQKLIEKDSTEDLITFELEFLIVK